MRHRAVRQLDWAQCSTHRRTNTVRYIRTASVLLIIGLYSHIVKVSSLTFARYFCNRIQVSISQVSSKYLQFSISPFKYQQIQGRYQSSLPTICSPVIDIGQCWNRSTAHISYFKAGQLICKSHSM